jgi:hypothetical protein
LLETNHHRIEIKISDPKASTGLRTTRAAFILPNMTLKNAALLALVGTVLITAFLVLTFVFTFLNVLRGVVPVVTLFSPFIYAFPCFSVAVFFFVFHRAQS